MKKKLKTTKNWFINKFFSLDGFKNTLIDITVNAILAAAGVLTSCIINVYTTRGW